MNKKLQTKNDKFLKGTALAFATAFAFTCLPVGLADDVSKADTTLTDKTIYLLEAGDGKVNVGNDHVIRTAYFDKTQKVPVGLESYTDYTGANIEESTVKVTYVSTGENVEIEKDEDSNIKGEMNGSASGMTYGSFDVQKAGAYMVSYSITVDGKVYSMSFEVEGVRSSASLSLNEFDANVLPTVYDVAYEKAKADGKYKSVVLPLPKVMDENAKEIEGVKYFTNSESIPAKETDYVVISAMGANGKAVGLTNDNGKIIIDGEYFNPSSESYVGLGITSISYRYYSKAKGSSNAIFVSSLQKQIKVANEYYKDYEVKATVNGDDFSLVTGVEAELPDVSATASFKNVAGTTQSEKINVSYDIKVSYLNSGKWEEATESIVDNKFTPSKIGEYKFEYTVTDFYGNSKTIDPITVKAEDTQAPEVFMFDASDLRNYKDEDITKEIEEYIDASAKLKSKTSAENIVIYAIGAKDNYSKLENIDLTRTIRSSSSSVIEIKDYNEYNLVFNYNYKALSSNDWLGKAIKEAISSVADDKKEEEADTWLKKNKFLKVAYELTDYGLKEKLTQAGVETDKDAEGYDIDLIKTKSAELGYAFIDSDNELTGKKEGQSYTVIYKAKDEAGKETTWQMPGNLTVVSEGFTESTEAPTVNISTVFSSSYTTKDIIKFEEPTASHDIDSRLEIITSYQFKNASKENIGEPVILEDKFEIDLSKAPAGASYVVIKASATSDYGVEGVFEKEIEISDINDSVVPTVTSAGNVSGTLEQNAEVILPTVVYSDDYVAVMNSKVEVYNLKADGTKVDVSGSVYDKKSVYNILKGEYTYTAGKITPPYAGDYEVVVISEDPANNIISSYYFFTVTSTEQDFIRINTSSSINGDGTAVVGKSVAFDIPTISYNVAEGKEIFGLASKEDSSAKWFQIESVSAPGEFEKTSENTFVFNKSGEYSFKYTADLFIVDSSKGLKEDKTGVYYESAGKKYYAVISSEGMVTEYKTREGESLSGVDLTNACEYKVVQSDVYTLKVTDSTESRTYYVNFGENGDYEESYALGSEIKIYSVGGDKNIDPEKSTIKISYNGPTSSSREYKLSDFNGKLADEYYDENGNIIYELSRNGSYTISYKIVDSYGKEYQPANGKTSYTIRVGDTDKPEIAFAEDFTKETYNLNEEFTIDISKIILSDNGIGAGDSEADKAMREKLLETIKISVSRKDDSGNWIAVENKGNAEDLIFKYKLETAGEYKITVSVEDEVGWKTEQTKTFTVSTEGKKPGVPTQTIGIILIVLSVLVLAGVIAYFVISKVKANKKGVKTVKKSKNKK